MYVAMSVGLHKLKHDDLCSMEILKMMAIESLQYKQLAGCLVRLYSLLLPAPRPLIPPPLPQLMVISHEM